MAEAKHTRGPWETKPEEVGRAYIRVRATVAGSRFKIANVLTPVYGNGYTPSDKHAEMEQAETRANARLIATAPELLDAAQAAWNCIAELPPTQARVETAQLLQAAIAKATGSAA